MMKTSASIILSMTFAVCANAAELYVAPNGNDANPGTAEKPFATIEKARNTIRTQKLNQKMTADLTVWLKGGRYQLNDTLYFDARDSGSNGKKVNYQAVKGETPVVCGGRKVTGWKAVPGNSYFVAEVPVTIMIQRRHANNAYVPKATPPDSSAQELVLDNGFAPYFAQLYVNGVRAERARSNTMHRCSQKSWWNDPATPEPRDGLCLKKSAIKVYTNPEDIRILWLEVFKCGDVPVAGIVPVSKDEVAFKMVQPGFMMTSSWRNINPGSSFFIVNALEELDEPGEWYLDQKKRLVYYYPFKRDGDLNHAEIYAPRVEFLLFLDGSPINPIHDVCFNGITFQNGNWIGAKNEYLGVSQAEIFKGYSSEIPGQIILDHAQNVAITGCVIRNLGSCGIQPYEGCNNILIDGNVTYDTTGAGISVGRYWQHKQNCPPASVCTDVTVSNNLVRNTGRDFMQGTGINIFAAYNCKVYHNDISDTAYTALHARIADEGTVHPRIGKLQYKYNKVSRGFQGHKWGIGDGGHIYMHGLYTDCLIAENYSLHANSNINFEYYSDNYSSGSLWEKNVSRYSNAHSSRFFIGLYNRNVTFKDNFGDRPIGRVHGNGQHINYQQIKDDQWPEEAQKIMNNAGLEPKWKQLETVMYGHENLADKKKCWASSVEDSAKNVEFAIDANWGNCWASKPDDAAAFWAVDLGAKHVLQRVCIMPRKDPYDESARKELEIQAANDPEFKEYTVLCERGAVPWYNKPGGKHVTNMWEQYLPVMPAYRYLRVKKTAPGSLSIAEFEAFGHPEKQAERATQPPTRASLDIPRG